MEPCPAGLRRSLPTLPGVRSHAPRHGRGTHRPLREITRCPLKVQDCLLSLLSESVVDVPELDGDDGMVFARQGFNVVAIANTRDRGVNEMSAALKRRFDLGTVFPIPDLDTELALVEAESPPRSASQESSGNPTGASSRYWSVPSANCVAHPARATGPPQ
ncbi:AAA family ATPase [Streptomyces sp. TRM76130]|nr:AAA family ATPase [Streptomyces sp. TRM76130]